MGFEALPRVNAGSKPYPRVGYPLAKTWQTLYPASILTWGEIEFLSLVDTLYQRLRVMRVQSRNAYRRTALPTIVHVWDKTPSLLLVKWLTEGALLLACVSICDRGSELLLNWCWLPLAIVLLHCTVGGGGGWDDGLPPFRLGLCCCWADGYGQDWRGM